MNSTETENWRSVILPTDIQQMLQEDSITQQLYLTDCGFYPNANGHYRHRPLGADEHILIYCVEGEGWYSIGNEKEYVKKNNFFIIKSGTPHVYGASRENPWSIYWIHFKGIESRLNQIQFNSTIHTEDSATECLDRRIGLFEEILYNLDIGCNIDNLQYASTCLSYLLATFVYRSQFSGRYNHSGTDPCQMAINYMKHNVDKTICLEEIAEKANYSISHFGVIFQKRTGYTPIEYFTHLKVQKACYLLSHTSMKIKEIAIKLGYTDQYYFTKVFTKKMGTSPTEYRNHLKG